MSNQELAVGNKSIDFEEMQKRENGNWEEFFRVHLQNYKNSNVKGKLFQEINSYQGKIFCFPVRVGVHINIGDTVMIDPYCEAYPLEMLPQLSEDDAIFSEIIGTVVAKGKTADGRDIETVFVRECAVYKFPNTEDQEFKITQNDICGPCQLDQTMHATKNQLNAFAGQVMSVEDDMVTVYVNLEWRD